MAGVVAGGREPADIATAADDDRSTDRSDPVDVIDGALRRRDRGDVAYSCVGQGLVEGGDLDDEVATGRDPSVRVAVVRRTGFWSPSCSDTGATFAAACRGSSRPVAAIVIAVYSAICEM